MIIVNRVSCDFRLETLKGWNDYIKVGMKSCSVLSTIRMKSKKKNHLNGGLIISDTY